MPPAEPSAWRVETLAGTAGALHGRTLDLGGGRQAVICTATAPALVLGSTQPDSVVDRAATARAGVEVVRRRSGGGAVLVVPGDFCWVDLIISRDDILWEDDVGRAGVWVGESWARALDELSAGSVGEIEVVTAERCTTRWSRLVCFAGLAPGEVAVAGRKVVGVSQRRTRDGAVFHCGTLLRWRPAELVALLDAGPGARDELLADVPPVAAGLVDMGVLPEVPAGPADVGTFLPGDEGRDPASHLVAALLPALPV